MVHYNLRPKAQEDLLTLLKETTKRYGKIQAKQYAFELDESLLRLCAFPLSGVDVSYIVPNYRRLNVSVHAIYYKLTDNQIDVIRILDQRMNPENWL